jgi:hypothetical protein
MAVVSGELQVRVRRRKMYAPALGLIPFLIKTTDSINITDAVVFLCSYLVIIHLAFSELIRRLK